MEGCNILDFGASSIRYGSNLDENNHPACVFPTLVGYQKHSGLFALLCLVWLVWFVPDFRVSFEPSF
jgi:hypothetical protein